MPPSSFTNSPCSRLNDDLLREIFTATCIDAPKDLSTAFEVAYYKPSVRRHPQLTVSSVCSLWRCVALLTPQLWNNIIIQEITDRNFSIAREYLSRARNLPVSIIFELYETGEQDWHSRLSRFLSSFRLQVLKVFANMSYFHHVMADLPPRSVADLKSLIFIDFIGLKGGSLDLNDNRYPKLSSLYIRGPYKPSGFSNSLYTFDCPELSMTITEIWDLLIRFPSLENARLCITPDKGTSLETDSVPQIQHQHLRSLVISSKLAMGEVPFGTFIEALALPVIEKLSIDALVVWSATAFRSLAHRSNYFPCLKDFMLTNATSISIGDVSALLSSIPTLESVYIYWSRSQPKNFDHLLLNDLATGLVAPRLHHLIVGYIYNESEFLDMVELRMKNAQTSRDGVPASFTKVSYGASVSPDYDRLRDMQGRGIQVDANALP